ncbi:helix-loop-helix protein delilah [Scaptodrosophila lebanonensis]|uniref:Helix-loop-helix protein delilah n=1 Tax=Drosophila lebanonensis TaxID=7225 RepID=A0A6J2THG0_DROLE|nr:helix-loop-helix protein delilah [Scaptodrosophila lebanonensis]
MKSNTYELHNYADLSLSMPTTAMTTPETLLKESGHKRKANNTSNGRRNEKYSLRQKRRNPASRNPNEAMPQAADLPTLAAPTMATASSVAMAQTTVTTAKTTTNSRNKSTPKAKTKAAPLSKYRRKTANARERTRMREINTAFEHLRHCVPQAITGDDPASANEKLTKITTLRLAMKYIRMLNASLENPSYESDFIVECLKESATREPHVPTEPEVEPVPVKTKKPPKSSSTKKTAAKRQAKQPKTQTLRSPESCYASSSIGSPVSCTAACSPSSAYASLSSSNSTSSDHGCPAVDADSILGGMHELSELNSLLLESDGESLPCLSPNYHSLLETTTATAHPTLLPSRGDMPISVSSLDKADVELSLRLLDSSADSFDFGSDQQPSACISPLAALDNFSPFSDLLQTGFPEASSLDLFLT